MSFESLGQEQPIPTPEKKSKPEKKPRASRKRKVEDLNGSTEIMSEDKLYEEKIRKEIEGVESIDELFAILIGVDGIETSNGTYSGAQLIQIIKEAWESGADASFFTKTLGIREAILKLRGKEEDKQQEVESENIVSIETNPEPEVVPESLITETDHSTAPEQPAVVEVIQDSESEPEPELEPELESGAIETEHSEETLIPESIQNSEPESIEKDSEAIPSKKLEYEEIVDPNINKSKFVLKINPMPVTSENYKDRPLNQRTSHILDAARRKVPSVPREPTLESDVGDETVEAMRNMDELGMVYDREVRIYKKNQKEKSLLDKVSRIFKSKKEAEEPESLIRARRAFEKSKAEFDELKKNNPFFSRE